MVEIVQGVHSIDGLDHPIPTVGMVSYLIEENPNDYTLVDTCFRCSIPMFESYLSNIGVDINDINRIVLTHLHPDHVEAANELKIKTSAKIYSHWIEAMYLSHELQYPGPPDRMAFEHVLKLMGTSIDKVARKFGNMNVGPIVIDELLKDGDTIGHTLQVIHTPGHTPGHISLYNRERRILIGGDVLFNSILNIDGLFIPPAAVTRDYETSIVSAKRLLNLKVDELLLAHQSSPILENAQQMMEKAVTAAITQ